MSVAEKAGQLIQYFYFAFQPSEDLEAAFGAEFSRQPSMVEAALAREKLGRCCSSLTRWR